MLINKVPPHNLRAEQNVIAAIMLDGKAYYDVSMILGYNDFYQENNRVIFYAIVKMFQGGADNVDVVTLSDFLQQKDKLESVGGTEYLLQLLESIPTASNANSNAKIVKEKSSLRKIINHTEKLQQAAFDDEGDVKNILDIASNELFDIIGSCSGYEAKSDILSPLGHASKMTDIVYTAMQVPGKIRGIPVGFATLDHITKGLRELTLIAADSGKGKTALSLNWAVNLGVKEQIPCLYINCEMGFEDLGYRILSIVSGIKEDDLTMGNSEAHIKQIDNSLQTISESHLFVTGNLPKTITDIVSMIYRYKIQHDIKVVFVDYMGEIEADAIAIQEKSEYLTYGRYAQSIKDICAKLDIKPVIVHQLNREGKIAGSLKLERKASLFCTLEQDKKDVIYLKVRKNRGGKCPASIAIDFDKPTLTITDDGMYYETPF